jgi:hypothetical protein
VSNALSATEELKRCLQAFAQPADVQRSLYPSFICVGDELGISFENALLTFGSTGGELSEPQLSALQSFDAHLASLSGPTNEDFWLAPEALSTDVRWEELRVHAKQVLAVLGWSTERPAPDGALYVTKSKVVRNT